MIDLIFSIVHEIPGHSNFCGRASKVYDIGRKKMNLAVVSIAGACEYTFGHEIGNNNFYTI